MKESSIHSNILKIKISSEYILAFFIILFAFQRGLEEVVPFFSYIDELVAVLVLIGYLYKLLDTKRITLSREYRKIVLCLVLYLLVNFIGNVLYRYQILSSVLIDAFMNIKFYLTLAFAEVFIKRDPLEFKVVPFIAKCLTVFLLVLFLVDYVVEIFPHGYRYGIKCSELYFGHPTYFAGCLAFLVASLSFYGVKKNGIYIIIDLFMMIMTLRSKAIGSVLVYLLICFFIMMMRSKLNIWKIILIGLGVVFVGWQQLIFYFSDLSGSSARSVMLLTSFVIMWDYFPIGTGFGTYGSHEAFAHYSPVYDMYGFGFVDELSLDSTFYDDQFWPLVFGQSGFLGTVLYLIILGLLFKKIQKLRKINIGQYISGSFCFFYLLISSTSEPAFNNLIAIPLGVVIGMTFLSYRLRTNEEITVNCGKGSVKDNGETH